MLVSIGVSGEIHLIGHIFMMQMDSFNESYLYDADGFLQFRVLIRVLELISVLNESWNSFILLNFNTLSI